MVKAQQKPLITKNKPENTLLEYKSTPKKTRQQINKENYQKNKEKKKVQQKERYDRKKNQAEKQEKEQTSKYYGAEAIKVLMSLKEYTELNKDKHKLWADFNWTLKDCAKDINDIVAIMKLEQVAGNLIRDYWETTKKEIKKGKSWNSLDYDEQQRLIRYWGYEKARIENDYIDEEEKLARQSQEYLKEIELAKYHEERGKVKCPCYQCQAQKEIQKEVKAKISKELKELEKQETDNEKGKCIVCGKFRELEEDGACKKCSNDYRN